jgi:hypothetical protein
MLETQKADLKAKRAALIARGMKPYRAEVSDNYAKDDQRRAMLILERGPKAAIRKLTSMAYTCHEIAPWEGPLPDPISGQIR